RNSVRDLLQGVAMAAPADQQQAWAQTARHPDPSVANQPLQPSKEHATYANFLKNQLLDSAHRNVYQPAKPVVAASSSKDDDAPDTGLGIELLQRLPVSFAGQSVGRLFNSEMGR